MRLENTDTVTVTDTVSVMANEADGSLVATVEVGAPPARVFRALASDEICQWWVRPGVFDTREWSGDVRAGGRWQTSGVGRGHPYTLGGTFLEVDAPRRLVHTWQFAGRPGAPSTVSYDVEPIAGGTRVTLRHAGLADPEARTNTRIGWETSFARLVEILADEAQARRG